jgi:hypothetical protein
MVPMMGIIESAVKPPPLAEGSVKDLGALTVPGLGTVNVFRAAARKNVVEIIPAPR